MKTAVAVAPTPAQQGQNPAAAYGGANAQVPISFGRSEDLTEILEGRDALFIQQRFETAEALAQQVGCACIEFRNKYDVSDFNTGEPLLYFEEKSDWFCRCCCKPYHTANIYGYDARPTSTAPGQIIFQIWKPFRCAQCPACIDFCQAEGTFFQPNSLEEIQGPGENNKEVIYGKSKVPQFGGGFTPTIVTMDREGTKTEKITGPSCIYGGCTEFCYDQNFQLATDRGDVSSGPLFEADGGIVKLKPKGLETQMKEMVGDTDRFMVKFPVNADASQRARLLGNGILLDYLFFETDGAITCNPPGCTLCNIYCCGVVLPCHFECNGDGGDGGG